MIEELCKIIKNITKEENNVVYGYTKGIKVFYKNQATPREPVKYDASIVFIFQGEKIGYLKGEKFFYNPNNYLVLSTPFPLECQSFASKSEPLIGMIVEIDKTILQEVWNLMDKKTILNEVKNNTQVVKNNAYNNIVKSSPLSGEIKNILYRILMQFQDKEASNIMGESTLKELYFQILKGNQASSLFTLLETNNPFTKIANTIYFINHNVAENISIEEMAKEANMSNTTFHRTFKRITGDSPIQFLKKYRLSKAKILIEGQGVNVNIAARNVGYESPSQFSREFKRLFGVSPKDYRQRA